MGLTNQNLKVIESLAKNDIHSAKVAALASLAEDKTKKNEGLIRRYRKMLSGNASVVMSNLPSGLETVLVGSSPSDFDMERHYIRPSDEEIVQTVIRMKYVADEMSARRIPYRNSTILYGESGTGKTELGKYIACKLNLPFFYISFVSTIDSYMGSTAKNLQKVFDFCSSVPCVLMLDEVDCVAVRRNSGGSKGADGELERTTIALMQALDRLPNHVVLIAATNRIDIIDEALLRRFSLKHEISVMDYDDLLSLVRQYIAATNTSSYIDDNCIQELISRYNNPGNLLPELHQIIGQAIFEEKKEEIMKLEEAKNGNVPNVWEVSYVWKEKIEAETEEDAIAIARKERCYGHGGRLATEVYTAERADGFLS